MLLNFLGGSTLQWGVGRDLLCLSITCLLQLLSSTVSQTCYIIFIIIILHYYLSLSRLHSADEDAVLWLTSYGSWNAHEKKKKNILKIILKDVTSMSTVQEYEEYWIIHVHSINAFTARASTKAQYEYMYDSREVCSEINVKIHKIEAPKSPQRVRVDKGYPLPNGVNFFKFLITKIASFGTFWMSLLSHICYAYHALFSNRLHVCLSVCLSVTWWY